MSEALRQSFFDTFNRRRENLQDEWYKYREAQGEKSFALFSVEMAFDNYKLGFQELVRRVSQMTPQVRALYVNYAPFFYGPKVNYALTYAQQNMLKWMRNGTMDAGIQNILFNFGSGATPPDRSFVYGHWKAWPELLKETNYRNGFQFVHRGDLRYVVGSQSFTQPATFTFFSSNTNSKENYIDSVKRFISSYLSFAKVAYDATKAPCSGFPYELIPIARNFLDSTSLGSTGYIHNSTRLGLSAAELRSLVESPSFMQDLETVLNEYVEKIVPLMADYQIAVNEYVKADAKENAFLASFHASETSFKTWVQSQADMLKTLGVEAIDVDKIIAEVKAQDKPKPQPVVQVAAPASAPAEKPLALPVANPPSKVIEGKSSNGLLIAGAAVAAIAALTMLG